LTEHEHVRHDVAATARDAKWLGVATGARVGIRRGETIEVTWKNQRLRRVFERGARAFGQRTPAAFLVRPNRGEEVFAMLDELENGDLEFLTVLQVTLNGDFSANRSVPTELGTGEGGSSDQCETGQAAGID